MDTELFAGGRIVFITRPVDMRCGFNKLSAYALTLGLDVKKEPCWLVFMSSARGTLKIIHSDDHGIVTIIRRLHSGRFKSLSQRLLLAKTYPLGRAELLDYLDGSELMEDSSNSDPG